MSLSDSVRIEWTWRLPDGTLGPVIYDHDPRPAHRGPPECVWIARTVTYGPWQEGWVGKFGALSPDASRP